MIQFHRRSEFPLGPGKVFKVPPIGGLDAAAQRSVLMVLAAAGNSPVRVITVMVNVVAVMRLHSGGRRRLVPGRVDVHAARARRRMSARRERRRPGSGAVMRRRLRRQVVVVVVMHGGVRRRKGRGWRRWRRRRHWPPTVVYNPGGRGRAAVIGVEMDAGDGCAGPCHAVHCPPVHAAVPARLLPRRPRGRRNHPSAVGVVEARAEHELSGATVDLFQLALAFPDVVKVARRICRSFDSLT